MYRYVLHTFRPSETIHSIIRLKGRHSLTQKQLRHLMVAFNELNGKDVVPKPGMTYKIPLPFEVVDDMGELVQLPEPDLPDVDDEGGID
jgi:hypothetical protein